MCTSTRRRRHKCRRNTCRGRSTTVNRGSCAGNSRRPCTHPRIRTRSRRIAHSTPPSSCVGTSRSCSRRQSSQDHSSTCRCSNGRGGRSPSGTYANRSRVPSTLHRSCSAGWRTRRGQSSRWHRPRSSSRRPHSPGRRSIRQGCTPRARCTAKHKHARQRASVSKECHAWRHTWRWPGRCGHTLLGQARRREQSGGRKPSSQAHTPSSHRPRPLQSAGHRAEDPAMASSAAPRSALKVARGAGAIIRSAPPTNEEFHCSYRRFLT